MSKLWSEREKTNKMQQLDVYYQHFLNMASHNRYQPHPAEPAQHTTCSNTRLFLLKMGIMMPETCWESVDNKHLTVASCWFSLLLHNLLTMHGHRNLKLLIYLIINVSSYIYVLRKTPGRWSKEYRNVSNYWWIISECVLLMLLRLLILSIKLFHTNPVKQYHHTFGCKPDDGHIRPKDVMYFILY